jgi:hypothetical protein
VMYRLYQTKKGARFALVHHTLEEWAHETYDRLIALGCSEAYGQRAQKRILESTEV